MGISPALPSKTMTLEMPAYLHPDLKKQIFKKGNCLFRTHKVEKVCDLLNFAQKNLAQIREDRGCKDAPKCKAKAQIILAKFSEKWNPERIEQADGLDHTPIRLKRFRDTDHKNTPITYNPDIRSKDDPYEEIRIFRSGKSQKLNQRNLKQGHFGKGAMQSEAIKETPRKKPARRRRMRTIADPNERTIIYTDGSTVRNGAANASGGAGIWYGPNHIKNKSVKVGLPAPNNQKAELIAILVALRDNRNTNLEIRSDSETSILGIIKHSREWEDNNWLDVAESDLLKAIIAELRQRSYETHFKWVKGHSGDIGNEGADKLADEGRTANRWFLAGDLEYDKSMLEDGFRLSSITMKSAYKATLQRLSKPAWSNEHRLNEIERAINICDTRTGYKPLKQMYLKSPWRLPVTNVVKDFIWKMQLQLLKCGNYFTRMGGEWEQKGICETCATLETPKHILFECKANGARETWDEVAILWERTSPEPIQDIDYYTLLSIGLIPAMRSSEANKHNVADKRLQIMVSYAAWTIWKARCSRKVGGIEWHADMTVGLLHHELKNFAQTEWTVVTRAEKRQKKLQEVYSKVWCSHHGLVKIGDNAENFKWLPNHDETR
jgi:ribonuclease HI